MKISNKYDETVVNNFIDPLTGELIDTQTLVKTHKIIVDSKDQFAFTYSEIIGQLKNLSGVDIKLLTYCSLCCEYNTNSVVLVKPMLKKISTDFDIAEGSIKNSIKKLVGKKILIPQGSGVYKINPRYYWRGEKSERSVVMKYILEVECPTC